MAALEIAFPVRVSMEPVEISIPVNIDASLLETGINRRVEVHADGSKTITYVQPNGRLQGVINYDPQEELVSIEVYEYGYFRTSPPASLLYTVRKTMLTIGQDTVGIRYGNYTNKQYSWGIGETDDRAIRHVQRVIKAFPEEEMLPIGYTVNMPWIDNSETNVYENPMILVAYGKFQKEGDPEGTLTWMGIFMSEYAQYMMNFDAAENEEATETVAQTGLYYFGKNGGVYTKLELEDGDPIPYDDYEAIYHNEIYGQNSTQRGNGINMWSHSAMRQYFNSSAAAGEWWSAQHIGDCAPSSAATRRGYLAGLDPADVEALQKIRILTPVYTSSDAPDPVATFDRVWITSPREMYGTEGSEAGMNFDRYWQEVVGITASRKNTVYTDGEMDARIARSITLSAGEHNPTNIILRMENVSQYGTMLYASNQTGSGYTTKKGSITSRSDMVMNSYPAKICIAIG